MLSLLWTQDHIFPGLCCIVVNLFSVSNICLRKLFIEWFFAPLTQKKIKSGHKKELPATPEWDTSLRSALPCSWALQARKFLSQEIPVPCTHRVHLASHNILNSPCKKMGELLIHNPGENRGNGENIPRCGAASTHFSGMPGWAAVEGTPWFGALWVDLRHFLAHCGYLTQVLSLSWCKGFYKLFKWEVQLCL